MPLSQTERDFLHASDSANRRRVHRRHAVLAILTVLGLGLGATAVLAVHVNEEARQARYAVISERLTNRSQQLAGTNPALSKLWSIAAWRIDTNSADARAAMLTAATHPGVTVLTGHSDRVDSVAFSPDGKTVAGGTADGTVLLWDRASRRLLGRPLTGHSGPVDSVAFSPDGKTLASGRFNQTIRLWNVTTPRQELPRRVTGLVPYLCALAGQPLTRVEWDRYAQEVPFIQICS